MELQVRLFASLKEIAGSSQVLIKIRDRATVSDLLLELFKIFPQMQSYSGTILVSINMEYADRSQLIKSGDEISIFPPVSGG